MDYKASKAWHHSHLLAQEVHELVREVAPSDKVAQELAVKLRRAAAEVPARLAGSVNTEPAHRLRCYQASQQALKEVYYHLRVALQLRYIEQDFFARLEQLAITANRELSRLIRSTQTD